jgi:signal transduction histidine kinase
MTRLVFYPAIKLMHRLKYPYKLAVVGLLALVAIANLLYLLATNLTGVIAVAGMERDGLHMEQPLLTVIQQLQKHRGLSLAVSAGARELDAARIAKEADIQAAIAVADTQAARFGTQLKINERWRDVKRDWETLRQTAPSLSSAANFSAHTTLIKNLLTIIDTINENSELLLDPDAASYEIMDAATIKLPNALELLGQLRARGAAALAKKEVDDAERTGFIGAIAVLHVKEGELDTALRRLENADPIIAARVASFSATFGKANEAILRNVDDDIISGKFTIAPVDFFAGATSAIDTGYRQLHDLFIPRLDLLLQERIDRLWLQFYFGVGWALAFMLLFSYFACGAYLSILPTIASLSDGADRIAEGDLNARIELETRDELSHVARRFNHMAEQLALRTDQLKESDLSLAKIFADYEKDRPMALLASVIPAITHDLNTPVNNVNLAVATLLERTKTFHQMVAGGNLRRTELDAFFGELMTGLDIIEKAGGRAGQLVGNLKRLSIDQASERRRSFDLAQLIDEVLTTIAPTLRDQPWSIEKRVVPGLSMDSYPGPLGQVLLNLIQNAAVHAFEEGMSGLLYIEANALPGERIRICVSDNGRGMSPETLAKVFSPFFTTKLGSGGSGVGLTYAQRLVQRTLCGSIEVKSALGQGTAFTLMLPRVLPQFD